ncbi:MAG: lysoplasmalogenase [Clostridiales bacterium]|jgi:hypothetical protein|nr:lysoplasmalogenase [Clostridiales bacterium]
MVIALVILAALALGAFCYLRDDKGSVPALFFKVLVSVLFMLTAFTIVADLKGAVDGTFFALIAGGLLFGLIGDILLDLKFIDAKNADLYTYGGMTVFAVGHILYISAVIYLFGLNIWSILIAAAIALVIAAAIVVVTLKVMKFKYGKFLILAALYSFLLLFFTAISVVALIQANSALQKIALLLTIGSISFLASDMILSMTYFGGKKGRLYLIPNHVLYYAAQFLIAFSLIAFK